MRARDFCYWLQGFFEVHAAGSNGATDPMPIEQVAVVKRHLNMVFAHDIDPAAGDAATQAKLNHLHHGHTGSPGSTPRC